MNKKVKYIFIIFIMLFAVLSINNVKASTNNLSISCSKSTLTVGESTTCRVYGTVEEVVQGVQASLSNNENISISNIQNVSGWSGDAIYFYGNEKGPGSFDIINFTVTAQADGTGTISLRDYRPDSPIGFIDPNGDYLPSSESDFNINIGGGNPTPDPTPDPTPASNDSLLTSLVPNTGELSPAFVSSNTSYEMSVDFTTVRKVSFSTTTSHPMANVGNTTCNLPVGTSTENTICNIIVTAEDRVTTTTYKINIKNSSYTPPAPPSGDIFINKLTYDVDASLIPTFKKDIYEYELNVNFANIHEINFIANVDSGITVTGKKCSLPSGSNVESITCNIKITKGDKSTTYIILVKNTNTPDIKCDLTIKSNVYTIDQTKKIIKVNSEHSLDTIKSNLYSTCGEIKVFNDKVTISDNSNIVEYRLEKIIMPQTGNNKIIYPLAIVSVLVIIGVFVFIKKNFFKKEIN